MLVQVLLSAYNGEKYIKEQIDCILKQEKVKIKLLVRNDGSKDNTSDILRNMKKPNIEYFSEENVGATSSFLELIRNAGDADFYAFSDQDDIWDNDKLFSAIKMLEGYSEIPAIYSSNTRLVDKNLHLIKSENKSPKITLGSALIKNYATGCTVVFNSRLMKYLKISVDVDIPYHDWWVNLVALSVGGISVFDNNPHISYRQHSNNVVGGSESIWSKWKNRFIRFKNQSYSRDNMARQLLALYGDTINNNDKEILNKISNYKKNRRSVIFNKNFKTDKKIDDFLFAICVLSNRI